MGGQAAAMRRADHGCQVRTMEAVAALRPLDPDALPFVAEILSTLLERTSYC